MDTPRFASTSVPGLEPTAGPSAITIAIWEKADEESENHVDYQPIGVLLPCKVDGLNADTDPKQKFPAEDIVLQRIYCPLMRAPLMTHEHVQTSGLTASLYRWGRQGEIGPSLTFVGSATASAPRFEADGVRCWLLSDPRLARDRNPKCLL